MGHLDDIDGGVDIHDWWSPILVLVFARMGLRTELWQALLLSSYPGSKKESKSFSQKNASLINFRDLPWWNTIIASIWIADLCPPVFTVVKSTISCVSFVTDVKQWKCYVLLVQGALAKQSRGSVCIGLYIPLKVRWGRNKWRNRDGTKNDYQKFRKNGGIPMDEPNGGDFYHNFEEKVVSASKYGWVDFQQFRIERLMCKMAATATAIPDPTETTSNTTEETTSTRATTRKDPTIPTIKITTTQPHQSCFV